MNDRPESSPRPLITTEVAIVNGLVRMIRQRDPVTASHLDAVGLLAERLCVALTLSAAETERITLAARLHDIGKQTISLAILNKPSRLSEDEWSEIRLHPHFGATIVAGFPQLAKFQQIVRSHHERVDGRGYPDGLIADEIPFEARIIAVVDAFHAMTVSRPYTRVRTPNDAIAELQSCGGHQFEPDVVAAFASMMGYRSRSLRSA